MHPPSGMCEISPGSAFRRGIPLYWDADRELHPCGDSTVEPIVRRAQLTLTRRVTLVDDPQLRKALKKKVLAAYTADPEARIIDELGLHHGASRVDVAVVNGQLHGYEIKSDQDRLVRLRTQIPVYNSVLDRVTLIVGQRHAAKAPRLVPPWWGVKAAEYGPRGGVRFTTIRASKPNPHVNPLSIARLLWRDEALILLEQLGQARGSSGKARLDLYLHLSEVAPLHRLRAHVRESLKKRTTWRFGQ
jgi:hypothetical protein